MAIIRFGTTGLGELVQATPNGGAEVTLVDINGNPLVVNTGAVSGSVTANAGTNLNTSALALETGGNLAAAKADLDYMKANMSIVGSGGLRSTLIDSLGTEQNLNVANQALAKIIIVPTTLTNGTTYWSLRNIAATGNVRIRQFNLSIGFTGTAAASASVFGFFKYSGATPTGGTAVTAQRKDTANVFTIEAGDIRYSPSGLTTTGVTFSSDPFHIIAIPNQLNADKIFNISFKEGWFSKLNLHIGEGIAIQALGAVVSGIYIYGNIDWEEV